MAFFVFFSTGMFFIFYSTKWRFYAAVDRWVSSTVFFYFSTSNWNIVPHSLFTVSVNSRITPPRARTTQNHCKRAREPKKVFCPFLRKPRSISPEKKTLNMWYYGSFSLTKVFMFLPWFAEICKRVNRGRLSLTNQDQNQNHVTWLLRVFPRLARAARFCFEFWLDHCVFWRL